VVAGGLVAGVYNPNWSVDIRSSRRLREGYRLALITQSENTSIVAATFAYSLRTLWRWG